MTEGDGPNMTPGASHPPGREVTCPGGGGPFVTDPPPVVPCPECGYNDW